MNPPSPKISFEGRGCVALVRESNVDNFNMTFEFERDKQFKVEVCNFYDSATIKNV